MTGGVPALSAVVIAKDAAGHLAATLASLAFCPERLVVDSGSTDDTVALARAAGARVELQPFLGYGLQKRRAVALAAHDWILSLDADEALDAEAVAAVHEADLSDPAACFAFRRRTFIGGREVRHGPWGSDRVLRLFNRLTANFSPLEVHEQVESRTRPRLLPGTIMHHSFSDCSDVLARSIRYARLKAGVMRAKGEGARAWTLPLRGAASFLKSYLLQGGWRDGTAGFVVALSRVIDSTLPRALLLLDRDGGPGGPSSTA
ncbi:MAG: glycosyltransferase family 2 protein [Planctomycetia bacterium]|nr:glycosyltransferase family 2 protein [Planctomycetia bacterium]